MENIENLPKWIQELYKTDPSAARKSEALLEALKNTLSTLESFIGHTSNEWIEVQKAKEAINKQ